MLGGEPVRWTMWLTCLIYDMVVLQRMAFGELECCRECTRREGGRTDEGPLAGFGVNWWREEQVSKFS